MAELQNRINQLNDCIRKHVEDVSIWSNSCELRTFSNGCGVFATRDIEPNELLFGDRPMMLGSSGSKTEPIVCVVCFDRLENQIISHMCSGQCGLVLCDKSVCAQYHEKECELIQKWKPTNPNEFSLKRAKALLVIRALFLSDDERRFFDLMQKNYNDYKKEMSFDTEFENFPQDKETIDYLRAASVAINTNGFKVLYRCGENGAADVNVRSFYPIMSLINHQCVPNSRHDINDKFVNRVFASRHIRKDEQIFISYSQLLWSTNTRRMHMMVSKQFFCACNRCADPTERSTNLSAIRCQNKPCSGLLLSIEPINFKSDAKCTACNRVCESRRFLQMQEMSAIMTKNFLNKQFTMDELNHFVEQRLHKIVPDCSQFVIECKLKAIWKCDRSNYDDLITIKRFCEDILRIVQQLGVGECSLKGFLAHELYMARKQLQQHQSQKELCEHKSETSEFEHFLNDDEDLLKTAKIILQNISAAPKNAFSNDHNGQIINNNNNLAH